MFFSVITNNLNFEVLTKNLVIFKRWDWVKDEILIVQWSTEKSNFQGGGFRKNYYIGENCLKRGAWTVCRFQGGLAKKRGGGVFERGR